MSGRRATAVDRHELRRARRAADLTQEQVADKLGLTRAAVAMYERGYRQPSVASLRVMARLYEVSMESLCREPENIP